MATVDPRQAAGRRTPPGDEGGDVEVGVAEAPDGVVHRLQRLLQGVVAAAGGAQGSEGRGAEACGGRAAARALGDRKPGAVAVVDEVEPVAADLVGRQQPAGQLGALDPDDPRREEVLLDLGGGGRLLAPPGRLDEVRVVVGELECGGALLGDVVERRRRFPHAEQQPGDAPAQPERLADAAGEPLAELLLEGRQALGNDLRSERRRIGKELGKLLRAGEPQEVRAVDVDDVQRDGDPAGAARLGDELVGHEVRRYLVEDVRDLQGEGAFAPQPSGRPERHRGHAARRGRRRRPLVKRAEQRVAGREMAIERGPPDARRSGDLDHAEAPVGNEHRGRRQDPLAAGMCVGAKRAARVRGWAVVGVSRGLAHDVVPHRSEPAGNGRRIVVLVPHVPRYGARGAIIPENSVCRARRDGTGVPTFVLLTTKVGAAS
jgi:hypothetical protein